MWAVDTFIVYLHIKPDMLGSICSLVFITHQTKHFKPAVLTFNCFKQPFTVNHAPAKKSHTAKL
jgi:hypothetical protein